MEEDMGCDIHVFFEVKVKGEWFLYSQKRFKRDYQLFGIFAGVRDDSQEPIAKPKGLPYDMSEMLGMISYWQEGDSHTHSWFDAREIKQAFNAHLNLRGLQSHKIHQEWGYLEGNGWESYLNYPEDYPNDIDDIRMVFWFDN